MQRPCGRTILGMLEESPSKRPVWLEQSERVQSGLRLERWKGAGIRDGTQVV